MIQPYEAPAVTVTLFSPLEHLANDDRLRTTTTAADDTDYEAGTDLESSIF